MELTGGIGRGGMLPHHPNTAIRYCGTGSEGGGSAQAADGHLAQDFLLLARAVEHAPEVA
jgi:hypothetical protein